VGVGAWEGRVEQVETKRRGREKRAPSGRRGGVRRESRMEGSERWPCSTGLHIFGLRLNTR
jgi:hypothetical protein